MVRRWSRSVSNFYALIGQNVTGEFMRKIYAASCNLFSLTAEADRVFFRGCISNGEPELSINFMKSSAVYAAGLCTFLRFETLQIWRLSK